jgi:O-antigen ligase
MTAPRPGRVLSLILAVSIMAVIILINTNSRSSILIKEVCAVVSALALMTVGGLFILTGAPYSTARISRSMLLSLLALLTWIVARHFTGIQSVNGPLIIFYLMALSGLVLAMALLFDRKDRDAVLWTLMAGTVILSGYALTQALGLTLFRWDAGLIMEARSSGSLGNPNLLGSFTAAMIPVGSAFLYTRTRLGRMRGVLAALFAILCIGAIIASKTRGSLIGIAALVVLVPLLPSVRKKGLLKVTLLMLAVLLLLGVAGFFLRDRLAEITDSDEVSTTGVRLLIWRGAVSMIEDRPWAGWGPGSFQIIFPQYRDPTYNLQGVQHNTLQVHCEYLEILSDLGIIGLLLWGTLAFTTAARVRSRLKMPPSGDGDALTGGTDRQDASSRIDWSTLGLIGGIVALLTEASVSVALRWPPSAFLLALLIGLLLASLPVTMKPGRLFPRALAALPLMAVAAFLSMEALPNYSRALISGRLLFMGKDYYLDKVETTIVQSMDAAANWASTGSPEARQAALDLFDQAVAYSDSSIKLSLECTEVNPSELGGWYSLGSSYLTRAMLHRPVSGPMIDVLVSDGRTPYDYDEAARYVQLGLESYDSLMARAPNYAEIHNNLALAWSNAGDVDRTLGAIRNAYRLYAQNRVQYQRQLDVIAGLATTPDVYYLIWVTSLDMLNSYLQDEEINDPRFLNVLRTVFFRSGTCMLYDPDAADSMAISFAALADSILPQYSSTLREGVEYQASSMAEGLALRDRYLSGDTTGLLQELSGYTEDQLGMLPMQAAIKGCLLAEAGDPAGLELLLWVTGTLATDCSGRITAWPLGTETFRVMAGALRASGLDETLERDQFDMFVSINLSLDWQIFKVMQLMSTSPGYAIIVPQSVQRSLDSVWADIGGPLYCVQHADGLTDGTVRLPFITSGSVLDTCMEGLSGLSAASPLDAELIKERVYFYYTIYLAFYMNNPAFTEEQSLGALDSLRSARNDLTALLGVEESRYQMNALFSRTSWGEQMLYNPQYDPLMQLLRTDIIAGNLPEL